MRVQAVGGTARAYCRLLISVPEVAGAALPGQFVHVLCPAGAASDAYPTPAAGTPAPGVPFLRRPFSLHDADAASGTISLLFRVGGPGTAGLAGVRPGDGVDLIGPLGGGVFPVAPDRPAIVCGGGIGVAPLLFLARRLVEAATGPDGRRTAVLIGLKGESDLVLAEPFRRLGHEVEVEVATEDGTPGTVEGKVTDLLETALKRAALRWARRPAVYACGPKAMLAGVWRLVERAGTPAWFAVEERMACGVGACRGCAVSIRGPAGSAYRLACVDGPVFEARELELYDDEVGRNTRGRDAEVSQEGGLAK